MADKPSKQEIKDAHERKAQKLLPEMAEHARRGGTVHTHALERHDEKDGRR